MPYFPQLTSLSVAQYPVSKERFARTILNETIEGRVTTFQDAGEKPVRWDLTLRGLTEPERTAIEELFQLSEGRLRPFVFPDPFRNLLARSEEFDQSPWQADPLLQLTPGLTDPFGGLGAYAILNTASGLQSVGQSLELPGDYFCCFSVYARAMSTVTIELARVAGSERYSVPFTIHTAWKRIQVAGNLTTATVPTRFEISVASGDAIELFGAQVEAQPWPSVYRKTGMSDGVHPNARFAQDELTVVAEGVDSFTTRIVIVSSGEGS